MNFVVSLHRKDFNPACSITRYFTAKDEHVNSKPATETDISKLIVSETGSGSSSFDTQNVAASPSTAGSTNHGH